MNNYSKYLHSAFLILILTACSTRKVQLVVNGANNCFVEIYNGEKTILNESLKSGPITDLAIMKEFDFNFKDSIRVMIIDQAGNQIERKKRLKKCNYIYVNNKGLDFSIDVSNKIEGGI